MEAEVLSCNKTGSATYHAANIRVKKDKQTHDLAVTVTSWRDENAGQTTRNAEVAEWKTPEPSDAKEKLVIEKEAKRAALDAVNKKDDIK